MTVKMYGPWVKGSTQFTGQDGGAITLDANGYMNVPEKDVLAFLKMGLVIAGGSGGGMPEFRRTVFSAAANNTLGANAMAYGKRIFNWISGGAALTHATESAANMIAVMPNPQPYDTWWVRILNTNSGNLTLTGGANVSFNGTAVVAANRYVDFMAYLDGNAAIRFDNVGFGNMT
jgi:hypothetical protein